MRLISVRIIIKSLEWVYARLIKSIRVPVLQSVGLKSFQGITLSEVVGFLYTSVKPRQLSGSHRTHNCAVISCGQNIVMSALEKVEVQKMLDNGTLTFYDRWVDDTFVRNKVADRDRISEAFHKLF